MPNPCASQVHQNLAKKNELAGLDIRPRSALGVAPDGGSAFPESRSGGFRFFRVPLGTTVSCPITITLFP